MSLESKSHELKKLVSGYDAQWFLGDLAFLIHAGKSKANDQLGELSSPQRQLYYLCGLNICSDPAEGFDHNYTREVWAQIVKLLNEIEEEYEALFYSKATKDDSAEWRKIIHVSMSSFLTYFNQGILNYEEQVIRWIKDLYIPFDHVISKSTGVNTQDFILFYESLDTLFQRNFQAHMGKKELLRKDWKDYTTIVMGVDDSVPFFIREIGMEQEALYYYMSDRGIISRFHPYELANESLPLEMVTAILHMLTTKRMESDFLYYTETIPGNPLYEKPIIDIGNDLYQVFDVKQVIHAIEYLLESIVLNSGPSKGPYINAKGAILEKRIIEIFKIFLGDDCKIFQGYFLDGNEQDILILWKSYAFIIETKGYALREPFRDPEKAFVRIRDDFKSSLGYAYSQIRRVEKKFIVGTPLHITDKDGKHIDEIDTTEYEDYSIIVNLKSLGQIQIDLSLLLELEEEDDVFPWAVTLDDIEIFILTMIAQGKSPMDFINYLRTRETLHGRLQCSDELELCGAYLTGKLKKGQVKNASMLIPTPDLGNIFDHQYYKGMGLKDERFAAEKASGKYRFL